MLISRIGQTISLPTTIKGFVHRQSWGTDDRLYLCVDQDNNTLTFSSNTQFPIGTSFLLEGRVKRHRIFNGQPQTHITQWSFKCI